MSKQKCRNASCAKAAAMAVRMAEEYGLRPEEFLQDVVDEEIAPVLHCRKSEGPDACKYGYEPVEETPQETLKGTWKVFICEKQKSSCKECLKHSGEMYLWPQEREKMPKLPLHPNCNCYYLTLGANSFQERRMR